ncbi:MAG: hypothetical protein P1V81_13740 [Planctomycetota bacterium]|nr:hypothetical protein [Planctomycetota bacterium]
MRSIFFAAVAALFALVALRYLGFAPGKTPVAPPAASANEAFARTARGLAQLNLEPVWDELPPAWQADAEELVTLMRASARPEVWERGFGALTRARDVLVEKAPLVRESQRLLAIAEVREDLDDAGKRQALEDSRAVAVATLTTVLESGLEDSDNLKYLDLRELSSGFLPEVAERLRELEGHADHALMPADWAESFLRLAALHEEGAAPRGTPLVVTMELPSSTAPVKELRFQMVRVEGRWLDSRVAEQLPAALDTVRAEIELWTTPPEGAADPALELLGAFEAGLDALEAAEDAAALDAALDELVGQVTAQLLRRKLGKLFG